MTKLSVRAADSEREAGVPEYYGADEASDEESRPNPATSGAGDGTGVIQRAQTPSISEHEPQLSAAGSTYPIVNVPSNTSTRSSQFSRRGNVRDSPGSIRNRRRKSFESRTQSKARVSIPPGSLRGQAWRFSPQTPLEEILPCLKEDERKFFDQLQREFDKVSQFYAEREAEANTRYETLVEQLSGLETLRKQLVEVSYEPSSLLDKY